MISVFTLGFSCWQSSANHESLAPEGGLSNSRIQRYIPTLAVPPSDSSAASEVRLDSYAWSCKTGIGPGGGDLDDTRIARQSRLSLAVKQTKPLLALAVLIAAFADMQTKSR